MAYDENLAQRVRELLAAEPGLSEKRMFGGLAFLLGGHMSVTVASKGGLLLRVGPGHSDELLDEPHVEPFVMRGRVLDGWLRVSPEGVADSRSLERWVGRGIMYARTLPPKRG